MSFKTSLQLAAFALPLLAAPAFSQQIKTDFDRSANFSQYHSYSWGQVQTSNPLNQQRVKDEVDRDLSAKGWHVVPAGGDIVLTAVGATQNQQEYTSFYDGLGGGGGFGWRRGWGGGGFGESTTTVEQIPVGTLVLDAFESNSKKLLWRASASDTMSTNADKNIKKLNKAVDKMIDKFPKGAQ